MGILSTKNLNGNPIPTHNSVWKNKNYVLLFLTAVFITFGAKIYELAIPLIVYELTHSSVSMGLMSAIEFLPNMILAVFIGAYIDRVQDKKRFMLFTIFMQAILLFALFTLMKSSYFELSYLYVIVFFLMTLNYGYYNVRFVIVKYTLPENLFMKATANFTFTTTLLTVLGPTLVGFILMFSDITNSLLIVGVTLLVSTFLTGMLNSVKHSSDNQNNNKTNSIFMDIKNAWSEFKKLRLLWVLTWFIVVTNATEGMFNAMIIFFAKENLHLNNSQVGFLLSFVGLGGIFGATVLQKMRTKLGLGKIVGMCISIMGIMYGLLFFVESFYVMCILLFFVGLFSIVFAICIHTYRQEVTPAEYIGRIVGITGSLFKLAMPICIFSAGWIASIVSVQTVFLLSGVVNIIVFLIFIMTPIWKVE
ncbi:TPA: MFS transporter [Bacillus cereus]